MASRNTIRALLLIILVLLISNLVILYLFVLSPGVVKNKRANTGREGIATILKDSVGFTPQQVARYNELRSSERTRLKGLFGEMRTTKKKFYKMATPPVSDSVANNLADSIGFIQRKIDLEMRGYFLKIREICEPSQTQAFDSIMSRVIIARMIGKQNSRGRNNNTKNQ